MTSVVQYNDSLNEANETFSKKKNEIVALFDNGWIVLCLANKIGSESFFFLSQFFK